MRLNFKRKIRVKTFLYAKYLFLLFFYSKNKNKGQVSRGLLRHPEIRVGEGISLQSLHHDQEEVRVGSDPRAF